MIARCPCETRKVPTGTGFGTSARPACTKRTSTGTLDGRRGGGREKRGSPRAFRLGSSAKKPAVVESRMRDASTSASCGCNSYLRSEGRERRKSSCVLGGWSLEFSSRTPTLSLHFPSPSTSHHAWRGAPSSCPPGSCSIRDARAMAGSGARGDGAGEDERFGLSEGGVVGWKRRRRSKRCACGRAHLVGCTRELQPKSAVVSTSNLW